MRLSVSVGISPREPLAGWGVLAAALEERGVDRIWLIDSQLAMKDVYVGLILAALRTRRIQLGTGVTNPLTRHPTVTAGAIAALAEVSEGRALLGVGAGDSAVYGVGWRPARLAQVEASLRFWRAVLDGQEGEWEGRRYTLPHTAVQVPIFLAVSQPRMCRLAGRLADGAIIMGPAQPELVRAQVGWIEAGIREAGRSRSQVDVALVATTAVAADRSRALDAVRSWASTQARLLAAQPELPPSMAAHGDEIRRAGQAYDWGQHLSTHAGHRWTVSDELAAALAVAGTPQECAGRLRELHQAGVDDFVFPLLGGGRLERLRLLQEEVLPQIMV